MAYFYKKNNNWSYRMDAGIDPVSGKRHQISKHGFKTKKEAIAAANEVSASLANAAYVPDNNITFYTFSKEWKQLYSASVKISTLRVREHELGILNKHFKMLPIQSITRRQYQKMLIDLKKDYADNTISGVHGTARMIFKKAREFNLIKTDPTEFSRPPRKQISIENVLSAVPKYLEKNDLRSFLAAAHENGLIGDYAAFMLLAYTGIRIGELAALTWQDIDFDEHTISITKTCYNPTNRSLEYILLPPKTTKSIRTIDTDPIVFAALDQYRSEQNIEKMRYRKDWHKDHDFVFCSVRYPGYPTEQKAVQLRITRLQKKLPEIAFKITPHVFRHTHTSLLAEADVPLHEIMDRLGHQDDETTRKVYLHVTKDKKKDASLKFAKLLQNISL